MGRGRTPNIGRMRTFKYTIPWGLTQVQTLRGAGGQLVKFRQDVIPHLSGEGCYIGFMAAAFFLLLLLLRVRLRLVLNHQLRMAVFPAGPQPRAPAGSVPRRTSTASSARQCSPPDLNGQLQIAVGTVGPRQIECQNLCQIECQNICQAEGPNISGFQKARQRECQSTCQVEC